MFEQPAARIVWPIVWLFLAPAIAVALWWLAVELLPVPDLLWGLLATAIIVLAVASLPVAVLRRSIRANHTAGTVLSVLSLAWALLVALALTGLAVVGDGELVGAMEIPGAAVAISVLIAT